MDNATPRISCADLKDLSRALTLAERGLHGLPIPDMKECISGIMGIIEKEEVSN